MPIVKCPKKIAEKFLSFVKSNDLLDDGFFILKEKEFLFVSVKNKNEIEKSFPDIHFVNKVLKKREAAETTLKGALEGKLSERELEFLRTAFDVVGTIAILDIPKELVKKEKIIAEALLKLNKRVKTVLKRAGIYEGTFRTRKLKYLAGEKTKETIHKENGVELKLDVEAVYFSTRSSTERMRVSSLVKPGEDVLVMFSGCAPFVCSIARNSKAKLVFGVEANPVAHKYALWNVRKFPQASVLLGDVRDVVPNFYKYIIGLKSGIDETEFRIKTQSSPRVFEFHLHAEDLFKNRKLLESRINKLKKAGVFVVLHAPFKNLNGDPINLGKEASEDDLKILFELGALCDKLDVFAVVHPFPFSKRDLDMDTDLLFRNFGFLRRFFDRFYLENNASSSAFGTAKQLVEFSKATGARKFCFDTCHSFIINKNNAALLNELKFLSGFDVYFHLADSDGVSHGAAVGAGKVDFDGILAFVKRGIVEIASKDEKNPVEMLSSYESIIRRKRLFDRIVMPLPKSAEDFLDVAFGASKKGTIIHFYDFAKKEDIPNSSVEKVERVAKREGRNVKILDHTICGDISPGSYRVCIDVEVLK